MHLPLVSSSAVNTIAPSTPTAQSNVSSSSESAQTAAVHLVCTADVKSIRLESASSPATIKSIPSTDINDEQATKTVIVDTPSVSPDIPTHQRSNVVNDTNSLDIKPNRVPLVDTTGLTAVGGHNIRTAENTTNPIILETKSPIKLEFASTTTDPPIRPNYEGNVFIKKEYLPSTTKSLLKPDKTREEVTRFLNFGQIDEAAVKSETNKNLHLPDEIKSKDLTNKPCLHPDLLRNENESNKAATLKPKTHSTETSKNDFKTTRTVSTSLDPSSSKDPSKSKSSSRRSSSSSNRDCSRCYKRSKIKRINVGVQCTRSPPDKYSCSQAINPLLEPTENCGAYPVRDLHCPLDKLNPAAELKYERFFHIELHTNGGASVVHLYQDEINELSPEEMDELVDEFFAVAFSEDADGSANHVMGIVHDAAGYLPDLLEHMSENYSTLTVKAGVMGRNSDIETSTMYQYNEQVIVFK